MPTTPKSGLPYPAATDAPDVPGAVYNLATALDPYPSSGWTSFVPGMTNISFSSTPGCAWRYVGGLVLVVNTLTGNVGIGAGDFRIGLPMARESAGGRTHLPIGRASYAHGGVRYNYALDFYDANNLSFKYLSGSPLQEQAVSSTAPFTPVNGDALYLEYFYQPA